MKESIHIKNLGPVQDIYIEDIKPMTVFIGESASGKSTIMKVIVLFRWLYKMHNIHSYLQQSNIENESFNLDIYPYINNCGFDDFINEKTEIIYTIKKTTQDDYQLIFKNNKLHQTETIAKTDLSYIKLTFISEMRNLIPQWAEQGARLVGADFGFYFHEVYNDFALASQYIQSHKASYLGMIFSSEKKENNTHYFIANDVHKYKIAFKHSSSGTQNAIPVSLIAEYYAKNFEFKKAFNKTLLSFLSRTDSLTRFKPISDMGELNKKLFIHLEEPELSLFPDAQCQLIANLVETCFIKNKNNVNLMFSTHSPYIINYLNLLIKAHEKNTLVDGASIRFDDVMVYKVEDGKLENLMVQNARVINTTDLSNTINHIYDRYNQLDTLNNGE